LLHAVVASALRGVIQNNLSYEYGNVLSYWTNSERSRHTLRDRLMIEVEEAFELAVDLFKGFAGQLSLYSEVDSLITEMISYNPVDGSMIVRISDG